MLLYQFFVGTAQAALPSNADWKTDIFLCSLPNIFEEGEGCFIEEQRLKKPTRNGRLKKAKKQRGR